MRILSRVQIIDRLLGWIGYEGQKGIGKPKGHTPADGRREGGKK
jgi:hypothetical protein